MHQFPYRQLPALGLLIFLSLGAPLAASQTSELQALLARQSTFPKHGIPPDRLQEFQEDHQKLETRYPQSAEVKNASGEFLWEIGSRQEAIAKWQLSERLTPNDPVLLERLSNAFLSQDNIPVATSYSSRAAECAGSDAALHFNAANLIFMVRHRTGLSEPAAFKWALHHFAQARRLAPGNAQYALAYAETYYTAPTPDWKAALSAWKHLLEVTADKEFALSHLARVHLKLGDRVAARRCLAQIHSPQFARIKSRLQKQMEGPQTQ